jgi:hypothetical protein
VLSCLSARESRLWLDAQSDRVRSTRATAVVTPAMCRTCRQVRRHCWLTESVWSFQVRRRSSLQLARQAFRRTTSRASRVTSMRSHCAIHHRVDGVLGSGFAAVIYRNLARQSLASRYRGRVNLSKFVSTPEQSGSMPSSSRSAVRSFKLADTRDRGWPPTIFTVRTTREHTRVTSRRRVVLIHHRIDVCLQTPMISTANILQ